MSCEGHQEQVVNILFNRTCNAVVVVTLRRSFSTVPEQHVAARHVKNSPRRRRRIHAPTNNEQWARTCNVAM